MAQSCVVFFFQAEDGLRDADVTGVQTCALPISSALPRDLMTGWFEKAVSVNPITYVVEAARSFLFGIHGGVVLKGVVAAALFSAFTFALTALAFRRRVRMG